MQNCLPLPMRYLTQNLSEEVKNCPLPGEPSNSNPRIGAPKLAIKDSNRELGDRTRRRGSGTV